MQAIFLGNEERVKSFRATVSEARFGRYLKQADGDPFHAIDLYYWNAQLAQCLYLPLQTWEIAFRNRLNQFLIWKYKHEWPYSEVLLRTLKGNERHRLNEAKERQEDGRKVRRAPTDAIVADLSAGFWVALLKPGYDFPFTWRYNLSRIYPHAKGLDREALYLSSDALLDLRNRVAHHEPVLHLDLPSLHGSLMTAIAEMCPAVMAYSEAACNFREVWNLRPLVPANDLFAAGPAPSA